MAKWKLYWMTDLDADGVEDCFIIARSASEAEEVHEASEGFDDGDAVGAYVADVPPRCERAAITRHEIWRRTVEAPGRLTVSHPWPSWARDEDLQALGATLRTHPDGMREVILCGKSYFPSTLEEVLAARAKDRTTH